MLKLGLIALVTMMVALLGGCAAPAGGTSGDATSNIYLIVVIVLFFGVYFFLVIRPQRKRQKQHKEMVQSLHKGDKVMTAGGIYGVVESLDESTILIKVESGATMRVMRTAVYKQPTT